MWLFMFQQRTIRSVINLFCSFLRPIYWRLVKRVVVLFWVAFGPVALLFWCVVLFCSWFCCDVSLCVVWCCGLRYWILVYCVVLCCGRLCCGRSLLHDLCPVGMCRIGNPIDKFTYFALTERYERICCLGVLNTKHLKTILNNARISQ